MLFSVIVPIYNVKKYLVRCLDSIVAQTCRDFEAILVDDGSTDGCAGICDDYALRDTRFRVIHKPNGGLISARIAGIQQAKGDYIAWIDGDDWAKPEMLQFVCDKLKEYAGTPLDMVCFAGVNVYADHMGATLNAVPEGYYDRARLEKEIFPNLLSDRRNGFRVGERIFAHAWDKICRREIEAENYVREQRITLFEDVPFMYECLLNCSRVYICNEQLYMYNKTNENAMTAGRRNYLSENFCLLVSYLQKRMSEYGPDMIRQANDYPVALIIRQGLQCLRDEDGLLRASGAMRSGLRSSNFLGFVSVKELPWKQKLFVLLLKGKLVGMAMLMLQLSEGKKTA